MSDEKKNELAPVSAEVEVIDTVDDQAIIEMMTGQTNQDYVSHSNRAVVSLRA